MKLKVWLGITLACSILFTGGVLLSTSGGIDTQGNVHVAQNDPPTPWAPSITVG